MYIFDVVKWNAWGMIHEFIKTYKSKRFIEEGMATHSSILAWRILRTEEPGGLYGHKDSRHNWSDIGYMPKNHWKVT